MKVSLGGGSGLMHDTGWRALKSRAGSVIIEQGVHEADLLIYFLGDIESLSAHTGLFAPTRVREGMSGQIAQFYSHRVEDAFANQETVDRPRRYRNRIAEVRVRRDRSTHHYQRLDRLRRGHQHDPWQRRHHADATNTHRHSSKRLS